MPPIITMCSTYHIKLPLFTPLLYPHSLGSSSHSDAIIHKKIQYQFASLLLLLHMIDAHNIMFKLLYLPYDISCLNKPVQSSSLPLFLHDCSSLLIYHILLNSVEVIQKNNNIKSQYRSISELYKICHRSRYIWGHVTIWHFCGLIEC